MEIRRAPARGILSETSGFIQAAGFTHSLSPARNCTFGCSYCYVPTMGMYGGLRPEDWQRWGQFTTFKSNAPELLLESLRPDQVVYCSPLVDPYQPAEAAEEMMPRVLDALLERPPRILAIQTRGSLILRDLDQLCTLSRKTKLRISFSLTTNRDDIRRLYEPLCEPIEQRIETIWCLRDAGLEVYATLAPLLPCDPEDLAAMAIQATGRDLIGDPFHVRAVKKRGATTREAALRISQHRGFGDWHNPEFQQQIVDRIQQAAEMAGKRFAIGPEAFRWLTS